MGAGRGTQGNWLRLAACASGRLGNYHQLFERCEQVGWWLCVGISLWALLGVPVFDVRVQTVNKSAASAASLR